MRPSIILAALCSIATAAPLSPTATTLKVRSPIDVNPIKALGPLGSEAEDVLDKLPVDLNVKGGVLNNRGVEVDVSLLKRDGIDIERYLADRGVEVDLSALKRDGINIEPYLADRGVEVDLSALKRDGINIERYLADRGVEVDLSALKRDSIDV